MYVCMIGVIEPAFFIGNIAFILWYSEEEEKNSPVVYHIYLAQGGIIAWLRGNLQDVTFLAVNCVDKKIGWFQKS